MSRDLPGDTSSVEMVQAPWPENARSIQRAFEELDAQLDAWACSMHEAECLLAQQAGSLVRRHEDYPPQPESSPPQSVAPPATASPKVLENRPHSCESGLTERDHDEGLPRPENGAAPKNGDRDSDPGDAGLQTANAPEPVLDTQPKASASATRTPKSQQDDEALLASLDPTTAEHIRVMRRLYPNNKSVRELLKDYSPSKCTTTSHSERKGKWWKR